VQCGHEGAALRRSQRLEQFTLVVDHGLAGALGELAAWF
jgi:hypothetical protein